MAGKSATIFPLLMSILFVSQYRFEVVSKVSWSGHSVRMLIGCGFFQEYKSYHGRDSIRSSLGLFGDVMVFVQCDGRAVGSQDP